MCVCICLHLPGSLSLTPFVQPPLNPTDRGWHEERGEKVLINACIYIPQHNTPHMNPPTHPPTHPPANLLPSPPSPNPSTHPPTHPPS